MIFMMMPNDICDTRPILMQTRTGHRTDTCEELKLQSGVQYLQVNSHQCFFIWRISARFLLLKNPGYQYKGGFKFKIA
jgi:hypothetical protein